MKLVSKINSNGATLSQQLAMRTFLRPFRPITFKEAREIDPEVEKAAKFVEGLFGTPIKSNRIILQRNPAYLFTGAFMRPVLFKVGFLGRTTYSKVHELIHIKDFEVLAEQRSFRAVFPTPSCFLYTEGRASFAAALYLEKNPEPRAKINKAVAFVRKLCFTPFRSSYARFFNSLVKIAREVGDPVKAFRITTEKYPGFKGIFRPLEFYKDEIEKAKREIAEQK